MTRSAKDTRDLKALALYCGGASMKDIGAEIGLTAAGTKNLLDAIRSADLAHCKTWGDKPKVVAAYWKHSIRPTRRVIMAGGNTGR